LAEKDLNKVCLVDNSPIAFDLYKGNYNKHKTCCWVTVFGVTFFFFFFITENGIALPTWISNPNDESLLDLLPFLDALRFAADVRSILKLQLKSSKK
jgi:CTD nuclear envelope phosphatase 1